MIEIRQLTKMWSDTAGLLPISFTVQPGEMVVVRGRSGSGKSTLLAVLAGSCAADSGEATVAGGSPGSSRPWSQIALVPQVLGLAIELSVRENITDAAAVLDRDRLDGLLDRLDLRDFVDRRIDEISMGQQQRVAIARALAQVPAVVLADEPTSYQDSLHARAAIDELRRGASDGCAVLVATHDDAVVAAADRVLDL